MCFTIIIINNFNNVSPSSGTFSPRKSPRLKRPHSLIADDCEAQSSPSSLRRSPRLQGVNSTGRSSSSPGGKRVCRSLIETLHASDDCASQSSPKSSRRSTRRKSIIPAKPKKLSVCGKETCGPCVLCNVVRPTKYWHLSTMDATKPVYKEIVEKGKRRGVTLSQTGCICNSCREAAKKGKSPSKKVKNKPMCSLNKLNLCSCEATSSELIPSADYFREVFSVHDQAITFDFANKLPFCKRHYMISYHHKQDLTCACCKRTLRDCDQKRSVNIDVKVATNRLKLVYDDVNIDGDSVFCTTCYMLIMKPRSHKSLDDVLLSLEHVDANEIGSENDVFHESVLNIVCKHMCETFKDDRALLFVEIQEYYSSSVAKYYLKQGMPSEVSATPKNRRWLLGGIRRKFVNLIEEHDTSATNMSKMFTYKHGSIKKVLHKLLFQNRWERNDSASSSGGDTNSNKSKFDQDHNATLYCAGVEINQRLREQAQKAKGHFKDIANRHDLRLTDFEKLLKFLDPKVWNTFTLMSLNSEEAKMLNNDYPFSWDQYCRLGNAGDNHTQLRFMRCVFFNFYNALYYE